MNEVTPFNFENKQIRTSIINEVPYFVGKDVAFVLGYSRPTDAIRKHVDEEDKGVAKLETPGGPQKVRVINESGVYSLVFNSKLPSAKKFKHWVTGEVLPSIRKKGFYQAPQTPMETLKLMFQATEETDKKVTKVEHRVTDLEDNQSLAPGEYNYISHRVRAVVTEYEATHHLLLNAKQRSKLYKDINTGLNQVTGIKTRTQLRKKDFDTADEYIRNWQPSTATLQIIKQLSEPVASNEG